MNVPPGEAPPEAARQPPTPAAPRDTARRTALALAVAAMGVVDVLSAALSHPPERLLAVLHLVPTEVLDTSRTFTLIAGALLLVTAWGLRRGKRRAFVTALLLCAVSVPVNLLKALDVEEATVAAGLMFALGVSADAFRVKSREWSLAALRSRALWLALALALYAVGGCWLLELHFGQGPSLARALGEAAYRLFGVGSPTLALDQPLAPAGQRMVRWFLGSLPLSGFSLLVGLALLSLRPVAHRRRHHNEAGRVAELVRDHGDSSVSAFARAADSDYFFSANGRAVIAYRFESDTLLGIGDPIGPPEELPALLEAFADHCRQHDWQFAFFQARPERLPLYRRFGWRALHIGEDPVLWTERFSLQGSATAEARRAVRKAEAAGLQARMFFPGETAFDPAQDPDGMLNQMRDISAHWLRLHHGGEKGFCMGRFDPHGLRDAWLAVAWNDGARRVEAFVTWVPVWARRGWALDLMRRRSDSAPGAMEFLVAKSVEAARSRGDAMLSLSLSALARVEEAGGEPVADGAARAPERGREVRAATASRPAAAGPDRARAFLMEHLARFYDFQGLWRWKKKFDPAFEDRYLVYPTALGLPRIALALVRAQSPGGLLSYFRRKP